MQELINELSKGWRAQRSLTQMTLGRFISELEAIPEQTEIENIYSPHSYRGYYSDLAFNQGQGTRTVGSLVEELKTECLNKTFYGYKGGDYYMDIHTPLWIAEYGDCGVKIIGIQKSEINGLISILTQEDEY
jgi:hypothetical protein